MALGCHTPTARADVIYHAFNRPFKTVIPQLPKIKRYGYTHIQISPPQKSHSGSQWYFRYQPIDHTVLDGPLGNEQELKALIDAAHRMGIKVIVDVVFNHMADQGTLNKTLAYPRFSRQHFHSRTCINYRDRPSVIRGWLGATCNLPDLATEQPYVRAEAKTYLRKLLKLGADGFRFDAAKHVEPEFFRAVITVVPQGKFVYGENIPENPDDSTEYAAYTAIGRFSIMDFFLTRLMQKAFGDGGDLRMLVEPNLVGKRRALPGAVAVTFARNHDTAKETVGGFRFGDRRDVLLANAFLLSRKEGVPLIYGGDPRPPETDEPADSSLNDADEPLVVAGVAFHKHMLGKPQFFIPGHQIALGADTPNMLFIRRGSSGLAIINKANATFNVATAKLPGMNPGCYQELHHNFTVSVERGGDRTPYISQWGTQNRAGISIAPRTALFLVQISARPCPTVATDSHSESEW
ncbi:MAG: alpha-amylase [Leptolyngbyaceae cyanobacterium RU_5_1]|nr:alpha-amylase [Leptolyngbyaceae cyanobacterium RU_5_1]